MVQAVEVVQDAAMVVAVGMMAAVDTVVDAATVVNPAGETHERAMHRLMLPRPLQT